MYRLITAGMLLLAIFVSSGAAATSPLQSRSLDGSGNNQRHADWGRRGHAVSARRRSELRGRHREGWSSGPSPRYVSNRIFNDVGQNLFSENDISQWGWAWGQFIDHDFGLRDETAAESTPIAFDAKRSARGVPRTTSARSTSPGRRPRRERA